MATKPVIGVIGCHREHEGEGTHLVKARYVTGVRDFAGAVPVILPGFAAPEDALPTVARFDGILLTGSPSNMESWRYGGPGDPRGPFDPVRDETTLALIDAARTLGKPLYGICRGLQEINVALGGTLRDQRDLLAPATGHHAPDGAGLVEMFAHHHAVDVAPGSTLSRLVEGAERIQVNSVHYQMIDRLGDGLRVEATADDGVVECVAARDGSPLFAVQWHPEWRPEEQPHHLAYWTALGDAARAHLAARSLLAQTAG